MDVKDTGGPDVPESDWKTFRELRDRDEELARAFDDPRRSRMIYQLAAIRGHGLLEPEEFERFSKETRSRVELLTSDGSD